MGVEGPKAEPDLLSSVLWPLLGSSLPQACSQLACSKIPYVVFVKLFSHWVVEGENIKALFYWWGNWGPERGMTCLRPFIQLGGWARSESSSSGYRPALLSLSCGHVSFPLNEGWAHTHTVPGMHLENFMEKFNSLEKWAGRRRWGRGGEADLHRNLVLYTREVN